MSGADPCAGRAGFGAEFSGWVPGYGAYACGGLPSAPGPHAGAVAGGPFSAGGPLSSGRFAPSAPTQAAPAAAAHLAPHLARGDTAPLPQARHPAVHMAHSQSAPQLIPLVPQSAPPPPGRVPSAVTLSDWLSYKQCALPSICFSI